MTVDDQWCTLAICVEAQRPQLDNAQKFIKYSNPLSLTLSDLQLIKNGLNTFLWTILMGRISFRPSDRQAFDPIEKRKKLSIETYICADFGYLTIFAGLAVFKIQVSPTGTTTGTTLVTLRPCRFAAGNNN